MQLNWLNLIGSPEYKKLLSGIIQLQPVAVGRSRLKGWSWMSRWSQLWNVPAAEDECAAHVHGPVSAKRQRRRSRNSKRRNSSRRLIIIEKKKCYRFLQIFHQQSLSFKQKENKSVSYSEIHSFMIGRWHKMTYKNLIFFDFQAILQSFIEQ